MDKKLKEIVKRVSKEEDVNEEAVQAALFIISNWTRTQLKEINYPSILWSKLGSFNLMEKRCPKNKKEILKKFKNNFKK